MSKTKTFLLSTGAAIALTLGACGGDKSESAAVTSANSAELYAMDFAAPDALMESVVANTASSTPRTDAMKTLALMGMSEDDETYATWDSMDVSGNVYTYTNVVPKMQDAEFDMAFGKVVITNPGMANGQHGVSRIVASNIALDGVDDDMGMKMSIGNVVLIDPPRALFEGFVKGDDSSDDAMEQAMKDLPISDWIGGGFVIDDVKIDVKNEGGGDENAFFSIDNVTMGRDSKTGDGMFDFAGFNMKFSDGDMPVEGKIGRIVMTGLDESIINNFKNLDMTAEDFAELADDEEAMMAEMYKTFYSNFNVYKPMIDGYGVYDVEFKFDDVIFGVDKMIAGYTENVGGRLKAFYKMDDMIFNIGENTHNDDMLEAREVMMKLGLETVNIGVVGYCDLMEKEDRFDCNAENNVVTVENAMAMKFGYDVTGYNSMYKMLASGDATDDAEAMMKAMTLNNAEFTIVDNGIMDRGFALAAEETGQSETALRGQAKMGTMALGMFAQDEAQSKLVGELTQAYIAFIDEGGTLSIKMNPDTPLAASSFDELDSSFDVTKLGLSFEHKN